ncbi:MAG: hypothetical protein WBO23_06815, partial [Burkholderiales bacterium]
MLTGARWRRYATIALSLAAGAAVWEVSALFTTQAFWAPLSGTLQSLAETAESGELASQAASSLELYATGLALALLAGAPLGLLMARMRRVRVALETY